MNKAVFVIVPAYNESRVIGATLQSLVELGYSVVVVDDCSSDGTWSRVACLPVHALRHVINLGQGAALQTGMTYALRCKAEIIVHFDADGQHRAEEIAGLIEPLRRGEVDVVLGSRFLREGDRRAVPPARRFLLKGGIVINGLLTGIWLTDAHNGFRGLTRAAAQQIQLRENRSAHASEILYQISALNLRCVEYPTHIVYTDYSRAKGQSAWNSLDILIDMLLHKAFG